MADVERELGLNQARLTELALLLGSDYTEVRWRFTEAACQCVVVLTWQPMTTFTCLRCIILSGVWMHDAHLPYCGAKDIASSIITASQYSIIR